MHDSCCSNSASATNPASRAPEEWAALEMPAMATTPKMIFFTDFDGTITTADSNDYLTDNLGYGNANRLSRSKDILSGTMIFRDGFRKMLNSVPDSFEHCLDILRQHIQLDPHFKEFFSWAKANNVPVVILSGGMDKVIEELLTQLLGPEDTKLIQVISNFHGLKEGGSGWTIEFRHPESEFGHDKSRAIRPYAQLPADIRPVMLYAGDGISDLSAARETDLLFAKKGRDLVDWCVRENNPFTEFTTWADILADCKRIFSNDASVNKVAKEGHDAYLASRELKA